jgi:hypothetical protein
MGANRSTEWENVTRVARQRTTLSFAVLLVDSVTDGRPSSDVTVDLDDSPAKAVENPSGFHLFLDLADDPVTLTVDGGDRYFDERETVYHSQSPPRGATDVTDATDASKPVEITLTPTPAYQFAAGTTLIRGQVTDSSADPDDRDVAGATVSLEGFSTEGKTTEKGEYALHVPATAENVHRENGTRLVKVPSEDGGGGGGGPGNNGAVSDPELTVSHPDHATFSEEIQVEAGTLTKKDVDLQ